MEFIYAGDVNKKVVYSQRNIGETHLIGTYGDYEFLHSSFGVIVKIIGEVKPTYVKLADFSSYLKGEVAVRAWQFDQAFGDYLPTRTLLNETDSLVYGNTW